MRLPREGSRKKMTKKRRAKEKHQGSTEGSKVQFVMATLVLGMVRQKRFWALAYNGPRVWAKTF